MQEKALKSRLFIIASLQGFYDLTLCINDTTSTCGDSQHLYYITKVIELLFKIKL